MPGPEDGLVQLWLGNEGVTSIVIGYEAEMIQKIEGSDHPKVQTGIADINRPKGLWDKLDFEYWCAITNLP
jgi:hypothetical protein